MNFLWIDTETTGRLAGKHDIIQLACIPIVGGKRMPSFNEFCQPNSYQNIEQGAINVHGITVARMKTFQSQAEMLEKFISYLKSFNVKFVISGFNVRFDKRFLSAMFSVNSVENEFFALFDLQTHDTYNRAQSVKKEIGSENLKLETLAKHYGVKIDAHNAISDIEATMEVDKHIGKLLKEEEFTIEEEELEIIVNSQFPEPAQLHLHSMYGMVESVPTVDEWAEWCVKTKTPGFSIVDHGFAASLYNITKISGKVNDKTKEPVYPGVVGIPGMGLYFSTDIDSEDLYPFNAWATSNQGYFNLMKLASLGYESAIEIDGVVRPRLFVNQINDYREGIYFGTGDVYGKVGQYIEEGDELKAERSFCKYIEYLGKDVLAEFVPVSIKVMFSSKKGFQSIKKNGVVVDGDLNKAYNIFLSKMVDKYGLECVPCSGAHFIEESDKLIQDCISRNSYKSGKCYNESYHVRTANNLYIELKRQLGDWLSEEKFMKWISNTHAIMRMAESISIKHDYHLPKITIPDHIQQKTPDYNKQTYHLLVEKCIEHGRWRNDPVYIARFKKEVDVIMKNKKLNFIPYFLLYEDICSYARSQGILQNIGRGSAGGSLISYYLKIIHINPIEKDLPFERFFSHARAASSIPDIDADFGDRAPIIRYLEQKYGLGFAQICTYSKMKTKTALQDAMFALYGTNREEPNLKAICELIPDSPQGVDEFDFIYGHTDKEDTYHPGLVEISEEVANFFLMYPAVEEMVKRLVGIVRGVSRHASAYVVSTLDLSNTRVPIMKVLDKHTGDMLRVTQFEASMCENVGLVKADILGVTTIEAVSDCMRLVKERTGIDYLEEDEQGVALIYRLPEDKFVYKDFYNKDTDSSFQFNTSLIKGYIRKFAPTEREHLSAMTALCRPGALDAPFVNDEIKIEDGVTAAQYYMDVRNGDRKLSYLHPDLALCTTNGIFVYQEEIMKFLVEICGYSLEEADQIRAAISKKKHDVMMATFSRIREATAARGWTREQADTVCNQVQAFARYSFNRSHSACYGELGYITMYLKHHHKLEWWTSILNTVNDGVSSKKEEKMRHFMILLGDLVTSPSLDTPSKDFVIKKDKIIAPLSVLKGVGISAIEELVSKGEILSLQDYINRVAHNKVNIGTFSSILQGRAADCFMDKDLPYAEARKKLMEDYKTIRKIKKGKGFKEELYKLDPINIFLMEKETNKCFNKSLLSDPYIKTIVEMSIDELKSTGGKNVPFFKGVPGKASVPVASSIKSAYNMVKNDYDGDIGLILLFDSSEHKKGVSKKSGKEWNMVKASLTDGFSIIESVWWDKKQALRWPKNSIIFVRGKISEGWGGKLNITVTGMERLKDDFCEIKKAANGTEE